MNKFPKSKLPKSNDRMYLHKWYVDKFNKTGEESSAMMAMWYHFLHLAFDPQPETKPNKSEMTKDTFEVSPSFNSKNKYGQMAELLQIIEKEPYARKGTSGICNAVGRTILFLPKTACILFPPCELTSMLEQAFTKWEGFSGNLSYPIPGNTKYDTSPRDAYITALFNRKSWTRSTRYGHLRWCLLRHCISYFLAQEVLIDARKKKASAERKRKAQVAA